jgi:hypothetical protein
MTSIRINPVIYIERHMKTRAFFQPATEGWLRDYDAAGEMVI